MGAGSNILASDKGLDAAVFRLSAPFFKTMNFNGRYLEAGGGASLNRLVTNCAKQGLSGAEFLVGIPGTVGGAIMMNAGQAKEGLSISDLIEDITVIDYNGKVNKIDKGKIRFGYRSSNLSRYIILGARLRLTKKNKKKIIKGMHKYILIRKKNQDYRYPSAGCIFKNPPGYSAGRLIELCGLKGRCIGAAAVSLKHANFIINKAGAGASDVLKLMYLIKKEVKDKFKISLKPEVKIWA
jgi:UDP-N-acetylmuramate dehydrogenase